MLPLSNERGSEMDRNLSEGVGLQSELKHREKLLREHLDGFLKKHSQRYIV